MLINELPLLPTSYKHWDWTISNHLDATDEQTQQAYEAITNKGLCSDFARGVWNGLVEWVYWTLYHAGIEWNDTYGTYEECEINEELGAFTSNMFNAVVLNLNQLGIFQWTWENVNNLPGYLGRTYVRGYAEYGNDADFVYGRYIIELTEKFNKLVDILSDEADFSELEMLLQVETINASEIFSGIGIPLKYEKQIGSFLSSCLVTAYVCGIMETAAEKSFYSGEIITKLPVKLESSVFDLSIANTNLALAKRQDLAGKGCADTYSGSELTRLIYVQRLSYLKNIAAKYTPGFTVPYAPKFVYGKRIGVFENVSLNCIRHVFCIEVNESLISRGTSELRNAEGQALLTISKADSYSLNQMILRDRVPMQHMQVLGSSYESSIDCKIAWYLRRSIKSTSYQKSDINNQMPTLFEKQIGSMSYLKSETTVCGIRVLEKILEVLSNSDSAVFAAYCKALAFSAHEKISCKSSVNSLKGEFFNTVEKSDSYISGELTDGIPALIERIEKDGSFNKAFLDKSEAEIISFAEKVKGKHSANIGAKHSAVLEKRCISVCKFVCELELQSTKQTWYDPVQTENRLYIRSAYPQWQEGTNVHLDSGGVFYEPEQSGTNVYIRSADSLGV